MRSLRYRIVLIAAAAALAAGGCSTSSPSGSENVLPLTCDLLSGRVLDATTGEGIEGAEVVVGGEECTTNADGGYAIVDLPAGSDVSAQASAYGYVTLALAVDVEEGDAQTLNFELVPTTGADDYRFVLTWGADPSDLDSHMWTELPGGSDYHVYFASRGTLDGPPYAQLDLDDVTGYGPETITVAPDYEASHPSVYTYAVYEYAGDGTLATSGAVVRVYASDALVQTLNVPTGSCGDHWYWYVGHLNVDTGIWTPVNTLSSTPPVASRDEDATK
jgi:hypothetical protein